MFKPVRTVAPAVPLLTTAEAKAQCKVDSDDDDSLIDAMVESATSYLDGLGVCGRCLVNQTWRQDFQWWETTMRLPFPDVSSITSVAYYDVDGGSQTVSASLYELLEDWRGNYVRFKSAFTYPTLYDDRTDKISITFVAGYGAAASNVPAHIIMAARLLVSHWHDNRDAVIVGAVSSELAMGVRDILMRDRRWAI